MPNDFAYEQLSALFRQMVRRPGLAGFFTSSSRVMQRYAQTIHFLREFQFDGVIDGGANIGEFAELVKIALPSTDLHCVEPHPACAKKLRNKGFQVVEAALWSESNLTLDLVQVADSSTSSQLGNPVSQRPSWKVNTLRLDAIPVVGENILVKLDLQGAEIQALSGMGTLWDRCAGLVIETRMGPSGNYRAFQELLESRGYSSHGTLNQFYEGDVLLEVDQVWVRHKP